MAELVPHALKDKPALIEKVFPAQKVSFEAQRERKANQGQTLTGLGSYWKGRKPLILVRAIVLGCLLPQTDNTEKDLELFEALMAFDLQGLGRRAVAQAALKPAEIAQMINLSNPLEYFNVKSIKESNLPTVNLQDLQFPLDADEIGVQFSWKRGITDEVKAEIFTMALATLLTYEERSLLCKRPEEIDQDFLYAPVLLRINKHLGYLGVHANSIQQLIEQLGILRFGHRPKVADTFCGGGSIPFEAARLGCDVYASDLNPIACMLTWGALNIIGGVPEKRLEIEQEQRKVLAAVDKEITSLRIEHDFQGNRAKAYLYCLETRCPNTGWMVPMAPSWVISQDKKVCANLIPNYAEKRFDIEVISGASANEMKDAETGTVKDGQLVYVLDGKTYRTPIKTLRGDYRDTASNICNRLRHWEQHDFKPRPEDIYQERLYCIQWIRKETLELTRNVTFFASVTKEDLLRERQVEQIIETNLAQWQEEGLIPDMAIERGYNTDQPIRERGWKFWHQLFSPRQILLLSLLKQNINKSKLQKELLIAFAKTPDRLSKLCRWSSTKAQDIPLQVFSNQALNTLANWGSRAGPAFEMAFLFNDMPICQITTEARVKTSSALDLFESNDLFITDPPYADAVHYHEITEFFIAWLRKNPPIPFNEWTWDSRRALAIKGTGNDFRTGMIGAYKAMTENMPDNGMQCVMFTHQDAEVWSDMVGIFWAAGLQVVAAWYIATETTSELKKGGYVQGTVTLILRKRLSGENVGFKQRILPAVRQEVQSQIEQMMHLNKEIKDKMGEPVFNDSDLQMAGYAAALKVLTGYTSIGGEDVTVFALRPRRKGETTVVDEIIQQASEAANSILIPEGLSPDTWRSIDGVQRFYLRMMDMETTGASKLDNYQNFAKA
ncbi:MAG: DUF1156 domain-containing protein, partial [bacterium]|nr:DUF1156 domain-containing protein [bacterium]